MCTGYEDLHYTSCADKLGDAQSMFLLLNLIHSTTENFKVGLPSALDSSPEKQQCSDDRGKSGLHIPGKRTSKER